MRRGMLGRQIGRVQGRKEMLKATAKCLPGQQRLCEKRHAQPTQGNVGQEHQQRSDPTAIPAGRPHHSISS